MTNGTVLRKLRERKRLSQKEVADRLNISQSTYSQWESDISSYKIDTLPKLADVFDTDITELIQTGTTVKIVNNSNNTDSSVNAFHVQMDAKKLHDDLFGSYESIIKAKDAIIESKNDVIQMLRKEIARLSETSQIIQSINSRLFSITKVFFYFFRQVGLLSYFYTLNQ